MSDYFRDVQRQATDSKTHQTKYLTDTRLTRSGNCTSLGHIAGSENYCQILYEKKPAKNLKTKSLAVEGFFLPKHLHQK